MSVIYTDRSTQAKLAPTLNVVIRGDGDERSHPFSVHDFLTIPAGVSVRITYLPDGRLEFFVGH